MFLTHKDILSEFYGKYKKINYLEKCIDWDNFYFHEDLNPNSLWGLIPFKDHKKVIDNQLQCNVNYHYLDIELSMICLNLHLFPLIDR